MGGGFKKVLEHATKIFFDELLLGDRKWSRGKGRGDDPRGLTLDGGATVQKNDEFVPLKPVTKSRHITECLYCICLPVAVGDSVERQSVLPRRREVLDAHARVLGRGTLSPAQERLASRQRFILTHHDVRYLQNKRETKQSIDHQITQQEKKP